MSKRHLRRRQTSPDRPPRAVVGQTTLAPRASTRVSMRFTMHAGMGGPHEFRVPLRSNDATAPVRVLIVRSTWSP